MSLTNADHFKWSFLRGYFIPKELHCGVFNLTKEEIPKFPSNKIWATEQKKINDMLTVK